MKNMSFLLFTMLVIFIGLYTNEINNTRNKEIQSMEKRRN